MKTLAIVALLMLVACQSPTAPPAGEWRMVSLCTMTVGQNDLTCDGKWERCWLTYKDNTFHCPSGDYPVAKPID